MQQQIPATYMRGGTSKGVFFRADSIPADEIKRDQLFLRIIGSPDPYGKQVDGMGGATSSTSKVVIVGPSMRDDCDVDYLFGAVAIDAPVIDYSGNCGNLTSAVGPFAIHENMVPVPADGIAEVRIWQANINKRIIAKVPVKNGQVVELGDFELDGVTFPAAEIILDFLDPADSDGSVFPTGQQIDVIKVPGAGAFTASLFNVGNPHVFVAAASLGLNGTELPDSFNQNRELLQLCEQIRAQGAVMMGLAENAEAATAQRPGTPKLVLLSDAQDYVCSSGKQVLAGDIDVTARILSMGKLHHAMTGTGGVALAAAAAIEGTLVQQFSKDAGLGGGSLRIGHSSGLMSVAATVNQDGDNWLIEKVTMSRSARRLMTGSVFA